ncbi:MAG: glycosyltransferase [Spirochaetota bacterium]
MSRNLIILPVYNRAGVVNTSIARIMDSLGNQTDLLVVDDGSEDETGSKVKTSDRIFCLTHEESLGYGAALINGLQLARDMAYDFAVTLDIADQNSHFAFSPILHELAAGIHVVNCSRMTKDEKGINSDYSVLDTGSVVSGKINAYTGYELADPFSPYKGYSIAAISPLEIEEYDENAVIQLWLQSSHFGLKVREIYCGDIHTGYITEDEFLEKDQDHYLDFIESEKILYPAGGIN